MSQQQFAGRVALVTGAASGIGAATARAFGEQGCRITDRRNSSMSDFFVAGRKPSHDEAAHALNWTDMLVSQGSQEAWSIPEAFLAILFVAVTCDGGLAAVEHEELLALAHRSRSLKTLTVTQLAALNVRILDRMRRGEAVLSIACAALPDEMRLPAFAHAFDLVLADGDLNEDEADFLNSLILGLNLHRDDIDRIVTVIELKNRF